MRLIQLIYQPGCGNGWAVVQTIVCSSKGFLADYTLQDILLSLKADISCFVSSGVTSKLNRVLPNSIELKPQGLTFLI